MIIKKILAYLIGVIFVATGGMYGVKYITVILCRIFGGEERVIRLLTSKSIEAIGVVEIIGIILGAVLGMSLGVALWAFIVWKTKWLTPDEIMKFIEGRKKS